MKLTIKIGNPLYIRFIEIYHNLCLTLKKENRK